MTTMDITDNMTTTNETEFMETTDSLIDSSFLKSIPMTSLLKGLRNMVVSNKTTEISEVYRSGMCSIPQYSMAEVSEHCDVNSCWIVVSDKIYDVTEFLEKHPGGKEIILEHAGHDATEPFESKGHSNMAFTLMEQYCVGHLIEKDRHFRPEETTTKI